MLNVEENTIKVLNEYEILSLIKKIYGIDDYNIAYTNEIGHPYGGYYLFAISEDDIDEIPKEIDENTVLEYILTDLAIKGHLEFDKYYIWIEY